MENFRKILEYPLLLYLISYDVMRQPEFYLNGVIKLLHDKALERCDFGALCFYWDIVSGTIMIIVSWVFTDVIYYILCYHGPAWILPEWGNQVASWQSLNICAQYASTSSAQLFPIVFWTTIIQLFNIHILTLMLYWEQYIWALLPSLRMNLQKQWR